MFLATLSQTVVATTMPLIIGDLGGSTGILGRRQSYMVTATLAHTRIVGRLSDIYGSRLFLLLAMGISRRP